MAKVVILLIIVVGVNFSMVVIYNGILLHNTQIRDDGNMHERNDGIIHSNLKSWHRMIPPIMHQTWKNGEIPKVTKKWVASWMKIHPGWDYWFWTDSDIREFFAMYVYFYYSLYMQYPWSIQKADVMRYFILWMYGGIYADLDMECLRPLDDLLISYPCIMAQEPEEISYIHHMRNNSIVSNALMACRPRHPFLKFIIDNLYNRIEMDGLLETTGPFMLTEMLTKYKESIGSYPSWEDDVFVAPADYFLPYYHSDMAKGMKEKCETLMKTHAKTATQSGSKNVVLKRKAICFRILTKGNKETKTSGSPFTNHHWLHTYINSPPQNKTIHIRQVVPMCKNMTSLFLNIPPYVHKGTSNVS